MPIAPLMWPYIVRTVDALLEILEQSSEAERRWTPPAENANSIAAIVSHTISNAEDNLIGTICGDAVAYEHQADFDAPPLDVAAVRVRWDSIRVRFETQIPRLPDEVMLASIDYPRWGDTTGLETMLVVARHTAEHLAQAQLTAALYLSAERLNL